MSALWPARIAAASAATADFICSSGAGGEPAAASAFMRAARAAGCAHVTGGLAMLVAQAAAQFELWTGQPAPIAAMHAAAEKLLGKMSG